MHALSACLIVFLGSGLGGALRHAVNVIVPRLLGSNYPHSTILVNVGGSFIMGLMAGWFAFKGDSSQAWRLFLATGVLGGFTTFSTFSLDAALLWERGETLNVGRARWNRRRSRGHQADGVANGYFENSDWP